MVQLLIDLQENLHYNASMPFSSTVSQYNGRLSPSDRQIVQEILSNPVEAAFLPAAEIGSRVGVHESTVVRLSRKLGYKSYRELRNDLRGELDPAERVRRRLVHTGELDAFVADEVAAMNQFVDSISQEQLDSAARALIAARRIFIFAQGHANALLESMDRRLRRSGFDTVTLNCQGRDLAEHLLTFSSKDVILGFAFHTQPPGLSALINLANNVDAQSVLVSDTIGPLIRPRPSILLSASRGAEDEFLTLNIPMLICNAIVLTIARLDGGQSIEALDRLTSLIRQFEKEDSWTGSHSK